MSQDVLKRLSKRHLIRMVEERDSLLARMGERLQLLEQRVIALEHELVRARKDSATSSKPPSSDIVKPPQPKKGGGKKRKIGGQPGHEKHERKLLPPEELDGACDYMLVCCPTCGCRLMHSSHAPHVVQHVELVGRRFEVTEHAAAWFWCPCCRVHQRGELPEVVEACGLFGPRMRAFVAYLKGACHMSYTTIQSLLADVLGIAVSTGYLVKVVDKASVALAEPYTELRDALAGEPWLNVDETGHKDRGKKHWTWCFPDCTDRQHAPREGVDHGANPEWTDHATDPREVDHPDVVGTPCEEHAGSGAVRDLGFEWLSGTTPEDPLDACTRCLDAQARELTGDPARTPPWPLDLHAVHELVDQVREPAERRQEMRVLPAHHAAPVEDRLHAEHEGVGRLLDREPVAGGVPEDVQALVATVVGAAAA